MLTPRQVTLRVALLSLYIFRTEIQFFATKERFRADSKARVWEHTLLVFCVFRRLADWFLFLRYVVGISRDRAPRGTLSEKEKTGSPRCFLKRLGRPFGHPCSLVHPL